MKKKLLVTLTAGFFMFVLAGMAGANVLTFDDITANQFESIPNGYGGLNWDEFWVLNAPNFNPANSGYYNGLVSGDYVAYNYFASVAKAEDMDFNFLSAYLTAAWNDGLNIQVEGYKGQTKLYDTTVVVDTTGPTPFNFGYFNIDRLVFTSFGGVNAGLGGEGTHFVMDNFTYSTTVPEPATMFLLGTGLVGVAGAARRKKENQA